MDQSEHSADASRAQAAIEPVSATSGRRLIGLDFTRGIAVLGILAANIVAFGQPFNAYMWPAQFQTGHGPVSDWMWVIQFVLIDSKMRGLFTLLFGAGMVLFMEKAWAKGATRWLQARRLFWLLMFGLIHFYFIWRGDILVLYSVAGFFAMLCLRWQAKTLMAVGITGYVLGAVLFTGMMGASWAVADTTLGNSAKMAPMRDEMGRAIDEIVADDAAETALIQSGDYAGFVTHNLAEHGSDPIFSLGLFGLETWPLMLIGMALFKIGMFSGGIDPAGQRKWGWIGVIAGTALTLPIALWAKAGGFTYWGTLAAFTGFSMLPRLPLILGLAALLALWGPVAKGWLAERLVAAGRMAFSNYLGTSILMVLVFHGWALGLFGVLNRPQLYLVVLCAWAIMLLWSKPWLARYRYGPLEWLWRCLTYWRLFPLRR